MRSIIGALNEGADKDVLEERGGLYYLNDNGRKKIAYVKRQIDSFLLDSRNIADYLAIVGIGQKSEYEFNKLIMDTALKRKGIENKFTDFLSQNSERIMDIARTTRHTGMLILTEISAYIRQFCLGKGYISAENRMWKVKEDALCQAGRGG